MYITEWDYSKSTASGANNDDSDEAHIFMPHMLQHPQLPVCSLGVDC